ncbi:hypothetical protein GW765_00550 [Candidatus Parcubacteria bacterium]|nr:hypothetical protein [Candidatus Parcubacteria bacterium]
MEAKNVEELIEFAVNWWANHISNTKYGDDQNGQLEGRESLLATFAKLTVTKNKTVTVEQIEAFKESLKKIIEDELSSPRGMSYISTDWGVEWPLSDACIVGQIEPFYFPMKTGMSIDKNNGVITVNQKEIYPE